MQESKIVLPIVILAEKNAHNRKIIEEKLTESNFNYLTYANSQSTVKALMDFISNDELQINNVRLLFGPNFDQRKEVLDRVESILPESLKIKYNEIEKYGISNPHDRRIKLIRSLSSFEIFLFEKQKVRTINNR